MKYYNTDKLGLTFDSRVNTIIANTDVIVYYFVPDNYENDYNDNYENKLNILMLWLKTQK